MKRYFEIYYTRTTNTHATGTLRVLSVHLPSLTHCSLIAPSSLPHCSLIASSLPPHCFLTASSLLPHCFLIPPSLLLHCSLIVPSLLPHCFLIVPSLLPHCFLIAVSFHAFSFPLLNQVVTSTSTSAMARRLKIYVFHAFEKNARCPFVQVLLGPCFFNVLSAVCLGVAFACACTR